MTRVLVVTAVRSESRAALAALARPRRVRWTARPVWRGRAGPHEVAVLEAGVGPEAARRAIAAADPYDVVVSLGFAGALVAGAVAGDLVLANAVLWEEAGRCRRYDVPEALARAAEAALPAALRRGAARGPLLSSPAILGTPSAKREAGRRFGAVAVEMEAAALAQHAAERGAGLLPLRAVLDPIELSLAELPADLDRPAGRARLLARPAVWPLLGTLRHHAAAAARTLAEAAAAVLPALAALPRVP
jgi:nucleoside phosphorylase